MLPAFDKISNALKTTWKLALVSYIYIIIFSVITILRHKAFLTSGFDLGIFNQAFWTTVFENKLFYSTGDLSFNPSGSFFGVHFSPILFLILPFYSILPSVETLLIIQSIVLALGSVPIFLISREKLGEKTAVLISILYLAYPPLHYLNLSDFHLEAFLPVLFLFTVYYLEHEKWPHFLMFLTLSMATIEFTQIIAISIVFYGFLLYRKRQFKNPRKAAGYIIVAFFMSVLNFLFALLIKEYFNPYTPAVPSPFHHLLTNPVSLLGVIFDDFGSKLSYLITFFAPLGFIPLLALEPIIMALPWIGASLITSYLPYHLIYFHYNGFLIPFIFIAFIKAVERIQQKNHVSGARARQRVKKFLLIAFLSTIILSVYLPAQLPGSPPIPWNYQLPLQNEQTSLYYEVLSLVPQNASILTQNTIFPHISARSEAYLYIPESGKTSVDYILVDVNSFWYTWEQPEQFGGRPPLSATVPKALENQEYGIVASVKGILLLKPGYLGDPVIFKSYQILYDFQTININFGQLVRDASSASKDVLYHGPDDEKGLFWNVSSSTLPPGSYTITYVMKIESEVSPPDEIITFDISSSTQNIASKHVAGSQISQMGQWCNITLSFGLENIVRQVEFKGIVNSNHEIYVDYIVIEQMSSSL